MVSERHCIILYQIGYKSKDYKYVLKIIWWIMSNESKLNK